MTAQAHLEACRSHAQSAAALETTEQFNMSEGYNDNASWYERDVARQHGRAAKAVDPNAPACP